MNQFKIQIPDGQQIDLEKSSLENGIIVFKPIKKQLPKSWEELENIEEGYYVNSDSLINKFTNVKTSSNNQNTYSTEELAKASIAIAKLSVLRKIYRGYWIPNWEDDESEKYIIYKCENRLGIDDYENTHYFLAFQSAEIRDEFLNNFEELIEEASPILFG